MGRLEAGNGSNGAQEGFFESPDRQGVVDMEFAVFESERLRHRGGPSAHPRGPEPRSVVGAAAISVAYTASLAGV
jgi:hypothetical protein